MTLLTASLSIGGGITLLASAATGSPDYVGIAAVITAITGAIGTLGTLWLAARKRSEVDKAVEKLLHEHDQDGDG